MATKTMAGTDFTLAHKTLDAMDAAILRQQEDGMRPHLGASLIGGGCDRALWYGFRWVTPSKHTAQLLRIFARGQDEETRDNSLTKRLRDAGLNVMTVNPDTGKQFSFKDGHFGGSCDGAAVGVPEDPTTYHLLEYKTHSAKSFKTLEAQGVKKSKPQHWAQCQVYMKTLELSRALYVAVCKDDDRLHIEHIDFDASEADRLMDKAQRIIASDTPPDGISTDPAYFECAWCDHKAICHGIAAPRPTCRSCVHATPVRDGAWTCSMTGSADLSMEEQKRGCAEHLIIPPLLGKWATPVAIDQKANWVRYQTADGQFTNGNPDQFGEQFSSEEIFVSEDKTALTDVRVIELRQQFPGSRLAA